MVMACTDWMGLRMDMLSAVMVLSVAIGAVLASQDPGKKYLSHVWTNKRSITKFYKLLKENHVLID